MECVATHNYKGQYEDELTFNTGDKVEVTADSKPTLQFRDSLPFLLAA